VSSVLRLTALGDVMLSGEWEDVARAGAAEAVFGPLRTAVAGDVLFANLETTIDAGARIPKQPTVVARAATLHAVLGVLRPDVVSLANNHAFDAHLEGFEAVRRLLDECGVAWFGAGRNEAEAAAPRIVERGGITLAWLGWVAPDTEPSHVASQASFGANGLDEERALAAVAAARATADHVVVSLHWGVEYCHLPSPTQIRFARALVDAGARVVLGHHAHAVQGVERRGAGVIAYNLGNVTTTDFSIDGRLAIRQTRRTRSAFALRVHLAPSGVESVELRPFRHAGGGFVLDDPYAARVVGRANRALEAGVSEGRWRRRRFLEDVVLRTAWKLDPRVVRSVRPRHVRTLARNLSAALVGRPS
jgi:poly-gamma-glutamate synthesis protein (capsule biosynthesis protein)